MNALYNYKFKSPLGEITITEEDGFITNLIFSGEKPTIKNKHDDPDDFFTKKETPLLKKAAEQIREYLDGKRKDFDLPLNPSGTDFMRRDWKVLQSIPYGETCSYKDVATKLGNPNACRAVGLANNRNPISIIIPCHRVIGANGKMVGYGGGLPIKEFLLKLERENN